MGLSEHLGQDNGIEELCEDPPYSVNCEFAELDFRLRPPPPNNPTTAVATTSCKLVLSESRLKELFFRVDFLCWIDYCSEIN